MRAHKLSLIAKSITAAFLLMVLLIGHGGMVRVPALQAGTRDGSVIPTVTFTMNLWNANPPYYSVAVTSMGSATYQSTPSSDEQTGAPYTMEFSASSVTQTEIFNLTQQLNFFQGKFGIGQSGAATTGTKSLSFADGTTKNSITYTSSTNSLIRKLTTLFENISTTLEFGHRLELLRNSNPSGLTAELRCMEGMAQRAPLVEFQVIASSVRQIASDATVSEASRRYARPF
jgi:hypothetical protein